MPGRRGLAVVDIVLLVSTLAGLGVADALELGFGRDIVLEAAAGAALEPRRRFIPSQALDQRAVIVFARGFGAAVFPHDLLAPERGSAGAVSERSPRRVSGHARSRAFYT